MREVWLQRAFRSHYSFWMRKGSAARDEWLDGARTLSFRVPSAAIPEEDNLLFNPGCEGMANVRIIEQRKFAFDARLVG